MATKFYREESRGEWYNTQQDKPTCEQINVGSLQRIADAAEKMAQNYTSLIEELDRYKRWYEEERKRSQKLRNRVAGLQGAFRRFRK